MTAKEENQTFIEFLLFAPLCAVLLSKVSSLIFIIINEGGTPLVAQRLRIHLAMQGMCVWYQVRELGSHKPWSNWARAPQLLCLPSKWRSWWRNEWMIRRQSPYASETNLPNIVKPWRKLVIGLLAFEEKRDSVSLSALSVYLSGLCILSWGQHSPDQIRVEWVLTWLILKGFPPWHYPRV